MIKDDCIFCRVVEGKIPSFKLYEDDKVLSFLDINPYAIGHILIIPKKHSKWLWDISSKEYSVLTERVLYLANVLRKAFETEWVEEVVAGIGVEHTHVHLMPRKREDGLGEVPIHPLKDKPSKEEMEKIAERIRKEINKNN